MDKANYYSTFQPATRENLMMCSISLNKDDRIRLIAVPPNLGQILREAIQTGWAPGTIQTERDFHGTHEFQLSGMPWMGNGSEGVSSRRLIAHVLTAMAQNGWHLIQSADVSKKSGDKDTLFFENGPPDPEAQIFPISLNSSDRIRLIDAPGIILPPVKAAIEAQWKRGIQCERDYHGSQEIQLLGNPWKSSGAESVQARMLLTQILVNIRSAGYKLYGSIDLSTGAGGEDLESLFFRKIGPFWQ